MTSPDPQSRALLASFELHTSLPPLEVFQDASVAHFRSLLSQGDPKRPLVADSEPPVPYDTLALKKIDWVRPEFLKGVNSSKAFFPVRRLLARLAAEDRGDELEVEVWEVEPKLGASVGTPSLVSIGHTVVSIDADERERRFSPNSEAGLPAELNGDPTKH